MGLFSSRATAPHLIEPIVPLDLTPVAETSHAQICCRTEAMQPNSTVPLSEKYVVRPKTGVCIQAKPKVYSGKVYYVVGMVTPRQGRKLNEYLNLQSEPQVPVQDSSRSAALMNKTEVMLVPNTTLIQNEGLNVSEGKGLEQFHQGNLSSAGISQVQGGLAQSLEQFLQENPSSPEPNGQVDEPQSGLIFPSDQPQFQPLAPPSVPDSQPEFQENPSPYEPDDQIDEPQAGLILPPDQHLAPQLQPTVPPPASDPQQELVQPLQEF